jgi:LysM repeat protein
VRSNSTSASVRIHTIASGETLASIARKYNIRLSALQSANPKTEAKRLRPGQTLVIPSP